MLNQFIRVGAATFKSKVADCEHNTNKIIEQMEEAIDKNISILVFPELSITSYTCQDLFMQSSLQSSVLSQLARLKRATNGQNIVIIVGAPLALGNSLYNCGIVISKGSILGISVKEYIPNYNEFYEKRWFASGSQLHNTSILIAGDYVPIGINLLYQHILFPELTFGIEICEDLWTPTPPSGPMALNGATLIFNPSASNDLVGKNDYRKSLVSSQSARTISAYIYASSGFGESTTDLVFGGQCLIYENGTPLSMNERFLLDDKLIYADIDIERLVSDRRKMVTYNDAQNTNLNSFKICSFDIHLKEYTIKRFISPHPFVPSNKDERDKHCEEIFSIQTYGLAKRLDHIHSNTVVIGISGGLDSTLALLVCTKTFDLLGLDRKNIICITMPGFGTTDRTYNNACSLIEYLNCGFKEISITKACQQHFLDIDHDPELHNITYENTQARERTQILMDYANKVGGLVIGTGDLSELALGWATYNGDHMSMYAVNTSIPKTLIRYLVDWVANTQVSIQAKSVLMDVLKTPVSPELLPPDKDGKIKQKTEEVIGPYELHDFFLYYLVRFGFPPKKIYQLALLAFNDTYEPSTMKKWLKLFIKRFFSQQFKRSCMPDGPKVGSINLSPRGDWRMPSDAVSKLWIEEVDDLE